MEKKIKLSDKQKKDGIAFMAAIGEEIISFNSQYKDLTYKESTEIFYKIMRKYGIKEGTWNANGSGRICSNFEWTMCKNLFRDTYIQNLTIIDILNFGEGVPKDLLAYGKKPPLTINID